MDRLRLMETYAAVVRLGSFTRAAAELGVTRAMVSRRIQDLEAALNVRLLNRDTHRLSVTAAGDDYYQSSLTLLAELQALEERMQAKRASPRGEIKVLSTKTFSETVLGPIVAEFCTEYPYISVQITLRDRDTAPRGMDIVSGGFDLAIRTLPVRDSSLVARPIVGLPRVLVASPRYLTRFGQPRSPAELGKHNCLDPSGAPHATWGFVGPGGQTAIRVTGTLRANSSLVVRDAALKGLGIAILREYLVLDNLNDGALVKVLDEYAIDERTLYVVYQKDRYQPFRVKLFIEYLTERMKALLAEPKRLSGAAHPAPARR